MAPVIDYKNGIYAIDSGYIAPGTDAVHLLVDGDDLAIIDTGVNSSVPAIMEAINGMGFSAPQVRWIILTHIHLDHAGGASTLMRQCPNARLVVHPRGVAHMVDPARLVAGTQAVYGTDKFARLYGEILPIDPSRIDEASHLQSLWLGSRELVLLDTPGHALHHICIVDQQSNAIFSGDTFGISYRQLDRDGRQFIFPTTTPVHFDPAALESSIDLLLAYSPEVIYLTHYSQVTDVGRLARELKTSLHAHTNIARAAPGKGAERIAAMQAALADYFLATASAEDWGLQGKALLKWLAMDIKLNAQGLEAWLQRKEKHLKTVQ